MHRYFSFLYGMLLISIAAFIISAPAQGADPVNPEEILQQTFKLNRSIKTISVTMLMKERVNNEIIKKKSDFKVNFDPYQVYIRQYYPNNGLEVLYSEKETGGKAYINRNALAFSFIKLDPIGNTIRKGNHHSLFKAGFAFIVGVLEQLNTEYAEKNIDVWSYEGLVKYADIVCYKIVFNSPDFHFFDYTIKPGENLEIISNKLKLSDYMIYENNPALDSFEDYTPGKTIKIPSDYAKQIVVYINKETLLPVGLKVFDEKGLFEEYSYIETTVNPEFSNRVFDSENPEYGFR